LLNKARSKQAFSLSLPILGGMMSQNILNLVDMIMVGVLGSLSLAAVGISSFINFMVVAFFIGLATGVQSIAARRVGEDKIHQAATPLNGTLLFIFITAIPLSIFLVYQAESILDIFSDDAALIKEGTPYLQARMAGMVFIGINFCFRGFWSAIHKNQFYLRTLLIMHAINIFLNYTLIFGNFGAPELGVMGAGLGTTVSLAGGSVMYAVLAWKYCKETGFAQHLPSLKTFASILKVSIPSGIQQLLFATGFTILYWIVGLVGTLELAAVNVITNVTLVAILPCLAFGISTNTLVSQAIGRGDIDDAYRWGWDIAKLTSLLILFIAIPMLVFTDGILGLFLHEQAVVEIARTPLRLVGLAIALDAIGIVMMHALQGAGATKVTMYISAGAQWLLFLPIAYWIGPVLGYGLTAIWIGQTSYRVAQGLIFVILWQRKNWQHIKI